MSKTAKGLVDYAKAQIGRPYWWGTFGQVASESLYKQKKAQYPDYYTASDFPSQYGQKVHDCCGLIKGYLWCDGPDGSPKYNAAQDVAVEGLYKKCIQKGDISSLPETPGVCVFMSDMSHVGVYIGGGEVVEAAGHARGVVKSKLQGRGWGRWGMPSWIDYSGAAASEPASKPASGKSIDELAKEVIAGKWGNGNERKQRLTSAGYDYDKVQAAVNSHTSNTSNVSKPSAKTIDQVAREVIRGTWGNGVSRIRKLTAAGYDYKEVQDRVNQLLR